MIQTPVIDFHAHSGRWSSYALSGGTPDAFVRVMDDAGVDKIAVNCIFYGNARRGNDVSASFVRAYPDRFIGAGYVTPRYPKEMIPELERCFGQLDFKFLKVYPVYYDKPLDHPDFYPIYQWCDERSVVIMSHSQYEHKTRPYRFAILAEKYPNVTWVLAHSGNDMNGQIEAVEAARSAPNMYLETCTSMSEHGTIEFLVDGIGEDRVLYGSDMPILDARHQLGRIVTADISDEAKRKILGLNAIELLGLPVPAPPKPSPRTSCE